MYQKKQLMDKWENKLKRIREEFIYIRNDYMAEFCWWYNIKSINEIKTELGDGEKVGNKPEDFRKIFLDSNSYLDELWPIWPMVKDFKTIFVRNQNLNYKKITLNVEDSRLKTTLQEGEKVGQGSRDFTKLYACSFGPFHIKDFSNSNFKILWILREPILTIDDLLRFSSGKADILGGIDQARMYDEAGWKKLGKKPTDEGQRMIAALLRTSKKILEDNTSLLSDLTGKQEEEIMNVVINHIWVFEVNHFPGLAFSSCENDLPLLKDWCIRNSGDLNELIDDFDIKIIAGEPATMEYLGNNENIFGTLKKMSLEKYHKKTNCAPTILDKEIVDFLPFNKGVALDSRKSKWFCWRLPCFSSDKEKENLSQAIKTSIEKWGDN